MTLLTTEILPALNGGSLIVFAADQRITRGTDPAGERPKIFRIPHLQAGLGYFGLAEVPTSAGMQPMSEWIKDFLYTVSPADSVNTLTERLADMLNRTVPVDGHNQYVSGFHVAGFNADGDPEFWYVRNVNDANQLTVGSYKAREDFARRDAKTLAPGTAQIYRNGDIRAHVVAWAAIDESFGKLLGTPSFRPVVRPAEYIDWVRFKMETIARFYQQFANESIIGLPIDAFAIESDA